MGAPTLVIVDGHALVYRAFHAIPPSFMTSRGEPTNAVYGFTSMLLKVIGDLQPRYCVVAFDLSTPTFRHLASAEYKATRPRQPDDLKNQFWRVRQVVRALDLPIYEREGYEADDVVGTLARQAEGMDVETVVVTGDMDILQLVDQHVHVLAPRGRISETVRYDQAAVRERYSLEPRQIPDLKALSGDTSDNIKGVPGIGEKTAARLLTTFATVEGLYARLEEVPERWRARLAEHEAQVRRNKMLATIDRDAPVVLDLELARLARYDRKKALALFQELEFRTLVDKLPPVDVPVKEAAAPDEGDPAPDGTSDRAAGAWPAAGSARGADGGSQGTNGKAVEEAGTSTGATGATGTKGAGRTRKVAEAPAAPATTVLPADLALVTTRMALDDAVAAVRDAGDAVLHPVAVQHNVVDFDLLAFVLALDGGPAWYIPVAQPAGPEGTESASTPGAAGPVTETALAEEAVLDGLRDALEDPAVAKVIHNAKVADTILAQRGVTLRGLRFDTMIAAYLHNPANRASAVKDLAFKQLGKEIQGLAALPPKGGSLRDVPVANVAVEAFVEARLIQELAGSLSDDLAERDQLRLFEQVELPLIPVLASMERAGIKVDERILGQMGRELAAQVRQAELDVYNDVGHQFTINSPQQLARVLVEELRLPLTKRTKTGYSTDATVLDELVGAHPVIEHVLTYRQLTKLKSTYVDALPALINPRTGRVHTTFNQAVTSTGRLSSDSPNLQNIPVRTEQGRAIRRAFVAEGEDTVLFAADYAQIELRIAAHITRDPLLVEAFLNDEDVHAATASTVFNVPLKEVTSDQRRLAKTTNFAVLYGISDFGLSQRVGIARSEAAPFIKAYLDKYAGIREYIQKTLVDVRARGYVETPLGRRRTIPEVRAPNAAVRAAGERMAINMPIQGAQADLIKLAMIAIAAELEVEGLRARMLLQVHDELVFEAPRAELEALARLVQRAMEGAMTLIVPIKVEMKVGENWYEMASYHLP